MNRSSNLLVLGVTGQVGKLVARNSKRREARWAALVYSGSMTRNRSPFARPEALVRLIAPIGNKLV
jgi:hypothetical protein